MSQGSNTSSSFSGPPEWYSQAAQGYLNAAGEQMGQPYTPYTGQRVAGLSPTTEAGIQGLNTLANGTGLNDDSEAMLRNTMQGNYGNPYAGAHAGGVTPGRNGYAGENPYFQGQVDKGLRDIGEAYQKYTAPQLNSQAVLNGTFGGGDHLKAQEANEQVLARQMGDFTNNAYNQQYERSAGLEENYLGREFQGQQYNSGLEESGLNRGFNAHENERGRQMGAVSGAAGLNNSQSQNYLNAIQGGGVERNYLQDLLNSNYGDFQEWNNYGQNQLNNFGNALSRSAGGAGSQSTTQGPGPDRVSQGLGGLALGNFLTRSGGGSK